MKAKRKNFTLIELLVAMAVIMVIVVSSMPAYSALTQGKKLTGAAQLFQATVMEARVHAVSSKTYAAILVFPDANSKNDGVSMRLADVYYDNDSNTYTFRRWSQGYDQKNLPTGIKIPFSSTKDFGLAEESDDNEGSDSLKSVNLTSGNFPSEIKNYISKAKAVIFNPNGQLAGTDEKFVVVRFVEGRRYDVNESKTPRLPLNINWLTAKAKFLEAVSQN